MVYLYWYTVLTVHIYEFEHSCVLLSGKMINQSTSSLRYLARQNLNTLQQIWTYLNCKITISILSNTVCILDKYILVLKNMVLNLPL